METRLFIQGGRLTLLKSILSSLPPYFLSLFTISIVVAARLERIQRNFLWGSSEGSFKYPLVAWDKVCSPIEMGGLGIRNVVSFNQALLGKWLCRYGHEVTHLWQRIISTKYGEGQGGWSTKICRRTHGCGLWLVLMKGGKASLSIFPLLWVMVPGFVSSMIDGLGLIPLKSSNLSYMLF